MTLEEWLSRFNQDNEEITVLDKNGEELLSWVDNDPKHKAKVIAVKNGDVVIDWVKGD